jgi:hypothetical protein
MLLEQAEERMNRPEEKKKSWWKPW